MGQTEDLDEEFAEFVEQVVEAAIAKREGASSDSCELADLAGPIADEAIRLCTMAGQQDPAMPGKLRVDAGTPLTLGGLRPNADAVIVVQFSIFDSISNEEFCARYNLADELLRYAEDGEGGWDVARQIQQLERTVERLRVEADRRGWSLPEVPTYPDRTDVEVG